MNDEQQQLDSVEAALRSLRPAAGQIDADQIIYEAGRAAGRRTAHRWQAGSAALALMLAASLLMHAAPGSGGGPGGGETREPIAIDVALPAKPQVAPPPVVAAPPRPVAIAPPPPSASEADSAWRYHALRRRVLEEGLDALQNQTVAASTHSPQSADELADIKRLLERPAPPTIREQPLPWWVHLIAGEPS